MPPAPAAARGSAVEAAFLLENGLRLRLGPRLALQRQTP